MLTHDISFDALDFAVEDSIFRWRKPDGQEGEFKIKVVTFIETSTRIGFRVRLAIDAPEGVELPEDFKTPAIRLGEALLEPWKGDEGDDGPKADIAIVQAMPEVLNRQQRRAHGARGQRPKR